jgi:hypothetical protein
VILAVSPSAQSSSWASSLSGLSHRARAATAPAGWRWSGSLELDGAPALLGSPSRGDGRGAGHGGGRGGLGGALAAAAGAALAPPPRWQHARDHAGDAAMGVRHSEAVARGMGAPSRGERRAAGLFAAARVVVDDLAVEAPAAVVPRSTVGGARSSLSDADDGALLARLLAQRAAAVRGCAAAVRDSAADGEAAAIAASEDQFWREVGRVVAVADVDSDDDECADGGDGGGDGGVLFGGAAHLRAVDSVLSAGQEMLAQAQAMVLACARAAVPGSRPAFEGSCLTELAARGPGAAAAVRGPAAAAAAAAEAAAVRWSGLGPLDPGRPPLLSRDALVAVFPRLKHARVAPAERAALQSARDGPPPRARPGELQALLRAADADQWRLAEQDAAVQTALVRDSDVKAAQTALVRDSDVKAAQTGARGGVG